MPRQALVGGENIGGNIVLATKTITIALAGNPNSGKTTLFNNLTGARQHVGNYPGVTVEKKEGIRTFEDVDIAVVDLPGAYSLTSFSPEELVARRFLVETPPDVVVDILDASNLERNLYLAVQLMELNVPLVLVCNMMDVLEGRGDRVDLEALARCLGVPVVPMVAYKRQGVERLLETVVQVAGERPGLTTSSLRPYYSAKLEEAITRIANRVRESQPVADLPAPWVAIKLLECDPAMIAEWDGTAVAGFAQQEADRIAAYYDDPVESVIAQQRYNFITEICESALQTSPTGSETHSDRIDAIVTHRVWGLPIFLGFMFLVFWATFTLGQIPSDWLSAGVGKLGEWVSGWWPSGSESPLRSLLVDGVIAGVGNVIVFIPNILILFFAIGLLEDSGYMPRAAFIMDRIMHKIGLHGKSFIPLLLGFGCSVPAIMATRTLENRRDRLTTMLVAPLMSCGARLPIYTLIIPAFFATRWQAPILWLIYLIGIAMAILTARLLRSTLFQGASAPFVMELPPYRIPRLWDSLLHMSERSGLYLRKAGTVILGISVLLWALTNFPKPPASMERANQLITSPENSVKIAPTATVNSKSAETTEEKEAAALDYSIAGRVGKTIEPVLKPMGFDWRIGTALIGALAAKEVFVAQMGIVYATGSEESGTESLRTQLRQHYRPLVGFCIMLFCLLSAPCMATFAVTRRESGSWRWACLQFFGLTALAYVLTTLVYQIGSFFV
jgi:ferrous iron transport protein B